LREAGIGTIGEFRDQGAVAALRRGHAGVSPGLYAAPPSFRVNG
jgi:hypothetical protein